MYTKPLFHSSCRFEVIDTHTDVFLVMEYVPGGELFDYIVEKGQVMRLLSYFQVWAGCVD